MNFRKMTVLLLALVLCLSAAAVYAETAATETDWTQYSYLVLSIGGTTYTPVPIAEDAYFVITRTADSLALDPVPEGADFVLTEEEGVSQNLFHISPEGIEMVNSTCADKLCVEQGEVTPENKATRLLGSMIICLPNQVSLELYTYDEAVDLMLSWNQQNTEE